MKKLIAIFLLVLSTSLVFGQANGLAISNKASGGAIGTAAATVDVASLFNVNQTTSGQTLTVPNLTNATNGKTIHINNVGSTAFTLLSKTIEPGTGILLRWTGSAWNISGVGNATGGGGAGDIEGVTAGIGLTGGGTSGTVTLNADTSSVLATISDVSIVQTDLNAHKANTSNPHSVTKSQVGLSNVDNTSDLSKPISTATQTALNAKENSITSGTTSQYWRGDKTFQTLDKNAVGLGNVDNTSDANKPLSSAATTALNLKANLSSPALTGTPTAPTQSPGDNSTKIATTQYVDAAAGTITTVGNIITEPCNSLSNWTQTGTDFTVSSGHYNISSAAGSTSFAAYIRQTAYGTSDIENFTITADLTVGTINSTSWGVGIGLYSQRTTFQKSLTIGFLMDNTNKGKIAFYFNNSTTGGVVSTGSITISSGDVTSVKIRQIKDTYIVTWTDGTQVLTASYTYFLNTATLNPSIVTYMPNVFNYTIYSMGGSTHQIDNIVVNSDEKKYPRFLFIGDSELKGYNLGTISRRAADIVSEVAQSKISLLANAGNWIEDVNTTEALSYQATNIIISAGINNLSGGDNSTTIMSKLATLISAFTSNGYALGTNLFVTTLRPYSGNDVTTVNASIRSTYPSAFIELYYPLWSGSGFTMNTAYASYDNLHLNEAGAQLEANIYLNYFNLSTKSNIFYSNKQVYADQQNRVAIGKGNVAMNALDVYSASSQIHLNLNNSGTSNSGGYLFSGGANSLELYGGLDYNGSTYTYRSTSYSGISSFGGDLYFFGATGVTAGSTTASPSAKAYLTSNGRFRIGDATTPTATLHLKAGTATASTAPLKFTSGTNLTTAEAGAMEYNGTNLFFTRTGTTRENVMTTPSVNTVSPTSPNRTITVVIDGVTYYIAAKTTND